MTLRATNKCICGHTAIEHHFDETVIYGACKKCKCRDYKFDHTSDKAEVSHDR